MSNNTKNNLTLIGMPGVGKSTVGVVLAKKLAYDFLDCDLLIQHETGKKLHEIIRDSGLDGFRQTENDVIASIKTDESIIATGGSAVYCNGAMEHLREISTVIYLKLSCDILSDRLGSLTERGVAIKEGWTLQDLYDERTPLYEKYADLTIECDGKRLREVVEEIYSKFNH